MIDPKAVIRTILYYPSSTGRNFDEIKRLIIALQKTDKEGVATPADWRPGEGLHSTASGFLWNSKRTVWKPKE
ncbi:MAG: hypothetical protein U5N58_01630 [Actinomycetota bacterium]|nr:hypothetical protein [Actinomycetota bacterium]